MDSALKTALEGAAPVTFTAVSIALNGGATIRLVSGGLVTIDGNAYAAEDSTYGTLGSVETIGDGADGQATRATITLLPPSAAAIAAIAAATAQGSPVYVYQGAVNPSTGVLIGVETLFRGELDFGRLQVGSAYSLIMECGTEEGRLLEENAERKLSDSFHQAVWPGELGLEFVTTVARKIYWRANDPAGPGVVRATMTPDFVTVRA
jgi:hypothetical protein